MKQKVILIKDFNVLSLVQQCLLEDFKDNRRNYTIFKADTAVYFASG